MNRFSTLAKLADSMLTTPGLQTWTASPRPTPSTTPAAPTGPLGAWARSGAPLA